MRMRSMSENDYGNCQRCNAELRPVWFKERELEMNIGYPTETGRTRTACSHLECPACFKKECVDDSFDRPWSK